MQNYKLTIQSDTGKFTAKVAATSEENAKRLACVCYGCPLSAIIKIKEFPIFYKVLKIGRKSGRRQVIRRYCSEEQAQTIVKSYPNSSRSIVVYINQNKWIL